MTFFFFVTNKMRTGIRFSLYKQFFSGAREEEKLLINKKQSVKEVVIGYMLLIAAR